MSRILESGRSYTFSDYSKLSFSIKDILQELDQGYRKIKLDLPSVEYPTDKSINLKKYIESNLQRVSLSSEDARKQVVIAPMLLGLCRVMPINLDIEYPINVNDYLQGTFDYYIAKGKNSIVVEAESFDLVRGMTQLAVELVAIAQWTDSDAPLLYGAVTTGDTWRFATYNRYEQIVTEDLELYTVPKELNQVLNILLGILSC